MSEHEASRVVQASTTQVFEVVSDVTRLPEWLPTADVARPSDTDPGTEVVHVEGSAGGHPYASDGFWRAEADQLRVEWSTPSGGGDPEQYAGWLQVADTAAGGSEVTLHLSFFERDAPAGVDAGLAQSLEALADLVER